MRTLLAGLLLVLSTTAAPGVDRADKPLTKAQLDVLVAANADSHRIAKLVDARGIDFAPTDADLEALRSKGAKPELLDALRRASPAPLALSQITEWLKAGTTEEALVAMVKRRGIDFKPSDDDLDTLLANGAGHELYEAVRDARPVASGAQAPAADHGPSAESGNSNADGKVYEVAGEVSPPVTLEDPNPAYTVAARKAKFSGVDRLAVTVDNRGNVAEVRVVEPVGYGLDENAVETVKKWKFKPATLHGKPVWVQVTVEIDFRYAGDQAPAGP